MVSKPYKPTLNWKLLEQSSFAINVYQRIWFIIETKKGVFSCLEKTVYFSLW